MPTPRLHTPKEAALATVTNLYNSVKTLKKQKNAASELLWGAVSSVRNV